MQVTCFMPPHKVSTGETGSELKFWLSGGGEISNSVPFLVYGATEHSFVHEKEASSLGAILLHSEHVSHCS